MHSGLQGSLEGSPHDSRMRAEASHPRRHVQERASRVGKVQEGGEGPREFVDSRNIMPVELAGLER